MNKISMYQITEELINEGSLIADLELVTTNDVNSNTCKAFANIMNDLGIDEGLFKENDKNYNFNEISKEAVKNIIKKNKIFRTEMKKSFRENNVEVLQDLYESVETILKECIPDEEKRIIELAKLNATNRYKKRESLSIFEELTLPSFKYSLSPSDTAVLREYYLYALKELQNEVLTILENMSDIRSEEIQLKKEEMLKTPNGNLKNPTESKLSKIKIKQEIVKMLAQKNTKTKKNIKKELESLTKETGLSEDTLKEELKNLLKSKDGISENFELVEVEEVNYVDFESSWELFEQVKKEYDEQVKAEAIFSKQRPKITDIELDELIAEYVKEI